eukprot:jgi/Tetstr1/443700/TSEL_031690.t1
MRSRECLTLPHKERLFVRATKATPSCQCLVTTPLEGFTFMTRDELETQSFQTVVSLPTIGPSILTGCQDRIDCDWVFVKQRQEQLGDLLVVIRAAGVIGFTGLKDGISLHDEMELDPVAAARGHLETAWIRDLTESSGSRNAHPNPAPAEPKRCGLCRSDHKTMQHQAHQPPSGVGPDHAHTLKGDGGFTSGTKKE